MGDKACAQQWRNLAGLQTGAGDNNAQPIAYAMGGQYNDTHVHKASWRSVETAACHDGICLRAAQLEVGRMFAIKDMRMEILHVLLEPRLHHLQLLTPRKEPRVLAC